MINPLKRIFYFSAAPRIVHNLPGRMRIHFPALEKLSSRWHRYSEPVAELVEMKRGIRSTNIQPATGNVLITYDADALGEKDIFQWLESIVNISFRNIRTITSFSEDSFESLLDRVKNQLMALNK